MNLKEKLKAAQTELKGLTAKIDSGDAEAIKRANELTTEIEKLNEQIKTAEKAAELLSQVGNEEDEKSDGAKPTAVARSLGDNFVEQVKASKIGKKFAVFAKAYNDVQVTPSTDGVLPYATTYDRAVVEAARTPLVIRDLFGAETISGSTLVYLTEGAIQGAPASTNEAAAKNQVHFADPTPHTVSLSKLTCFIKESDEYINDYPFLASAINGRLLYHLGLVEQNTLVSALLGTSGIQSDLTSWTASSVAREIADLILSAAMDVQQQSGFAADAIVLNPTDWYTLRVGKDGNNQYYGGGYFGQQNVPNLWGIPVCVSTAVSAGTAIVGAFKTCGSVVTNGGVSVEATNTDQDDFIKNLMTIRAEERLALAVRRPAGFKKLVKAS